MNRFLIVLTLFGCIAGVCLANDGENYTISGQPILPETYKALKQAGYLPLKPELTDREMAEKFDLSLPKMASVKAALESNDPVALQKALGAYLNKQLPPRTYAPTGKPPRNPELAQRLIDGELVIGNNRFPMGKKINWWQSLGPGGMTDGGPGTEGWGGWAHALENAYEDTGDPKYAEAMLDYARTFHHSVRPFSKADWGSVFLGPWHPLWVSGRIMPAYVPAVYQYIGNYSGVTDADRVMFLKILWESTDYTYHIMDERKEHNFEVHVGTGLMNMALTFPEFRDSKLWLDRIKDRFSQQIEGTVVDDGGAFERTGYHFAYVASFGNNYKLLRDAGAPLPESFKVRLGQMYEWNTWMLAPTLEWPMFGHGGLGPMNSIAECGAELFPERADFAFVASYGKSGVAPRTVARVLPDSGFLAMRSDWSRDARYMAFSFNGTPRGTDGHDDLFSFGLWAFGRPWMTNPGTTSPYGTDEERNWNEHSQAANGQVLIDHKTQGRMDNGGRLETWTNLPAEGPGITYLSAVNRQQEKIGASWRRAILFCRPNYWLIYDVLSPVPAASSTEHNYDWIARFQPTDLTIDPATKSIVTAPQEGKVLWLVPAGAESLKLSQSSAPMITRDADPTIAAPLNPNRKMAPVITMTKAAMKSPVSFATLLCPAEATAPPPTVKTLAVKEGNRNLDTAQAVGLLVHGSDSDDVIAMSSNWSASKTIRRYGEGEQSVSTDGEMAIVRLRDGKVVETALIGGRQLNNNARSLIRSADSISALYVRYVEDRAEVTVEGRGHVAVATLGATRILVNGKQTTAPIEGEMFNLDNDIEGKLTLTKLRAANDVETLTKVVGLPMQRSQGVWERNAIDSAVISWSTSEPADGAVMYQAVGQTQWNRTLNPELLTDHRIMLSGLIPGKKYEVRVVSQTREGKTGTAKLLFQQASPDSRK